VFQTALAEQHRIVAYLDGLQAQVGELTALTGRHPGRAGRTAAIGAGSSVSGGVERRSAERPEKGGQYFTVHLAVEGEATRLAMQVDLDRRRMAQDGRLDGLHILQTNLLDKGSSLLEVLTTYQEQYHAEFSFRDLQGPMAVSPVFLHTPDRIKCRKQVITFCIAAGWLNQISRNITTLH
jgi:hypothetical protein